MMSKSASSPTKKRGATKMLVSEMAEALTREYAIQKRKSLSTLSGRLKLHLLPALGHLAAAEVTAEEVECYVAERQEEGAPSSTINRELAALKRMYKLALIKRQIEPKEVPYIPHLREDNVREGTLPADKYEALAQATADIGLWLRALFELGYTYGLRKGALLSLKAGQVDLIQRKITMKPGSGTKRKPPRIFMTAKVYELLTQCCAGKKPEEYVFTREHTRRGRKPRNSGRISDLRDAWAEATKAAGCPELLFHDLRRTGLTNMIEEAHLDEKRAMEISGHRTRSVFDRYHIVAESRQKEAANLIERAALERRKQVRQAELFPAQNSTGTLGKPQ